MLLNPFFIRAFSSWFYTGGGGGGGGTGEAQSARGRFLFNGATAIKLGTLRN